MDLARLAFELAKDLVEHVKRGEKLLALDLVHRMLDFQDQSLVASHEHVLDVVTRLGWGHSARGMPLGK